MPTAEKILSTAEGSYRILTVDDDPVMRALITTALTRAGFEVWAAASGQEALSLLESRGLPHLALIDIMMSGMDGLELCRRIHDFADLPIILVTSVDDLETKVDAIETLVEDYITKPFAAAELLARVRRLLRRVGEFSYTIASRVRVDDRLEIEFARRQVLVEGRAIELTPTESKLLYLLLRSAGRPLRTEYLLRRLWPFEEVFEEALRTHLWRLRKKIEPVPRKSRYIITHRGLGYSFRRLEG